MSASKWLGLVVLAVGLVASTAGRCAAGGYVAHTRSVYDRFGNVRVAVVTIRTDHSAWWFIVPGPVLNLPVAVQVALLNRRLGFGFDAPIVGQVLQNMQQQRQLQNQLNQQMRMQQLQNQLQQQQQLQNQLQQLNRPLFPQPIQPVLPPRIR